MTPTLLWIAATICLVWDGPGVVRRLRRAWRRAHDATPAAAPTPRTALAVSRLYLGDLLAYQTTTHDSGQTVQVRKGVPVSIVEVIP